MANSGSVIVNDLTANAGGTFNPTTLDTGTVAVALNAAIAGRAERFLMIVDNTAGADLTVSVAAGDNPPAFRKALGAVSATVATSTEQVIGPFEGARVLQDDGSVNVTFTPASGTIAATVRAVVLPKL